MKVLAHLNKSIVLAVQLNGNKMEETNKKNNLFKNFQVFITSNLRYILIGVGLFLITFILFQVYSYISLQDIKKSSIVFFNSIENNEEILDDLNSIKKNDNIYSVLSTLKIIENSNKNKNYNISNELYKEVILSKKINTLYKSSIAVHAAHTLINASYLESTNKYIEDISFFIKNISDELESFFSIKKELQYMLIVTEGDINKSEYKNNNLALKLFDEIIKSSSISSSVKERVKKIHEFQIYK